MKKALLFFVCITIMFTTKAQNGTAIEYLDINNVKAAVNSAGDLFTDFVNSTPQFEVPKGSGKNTIFASNLWFGGYDGGGQLKLAAQTYRQFGANDFWPGPLTNSGIIDSATMVTYDRLWKINKCDIDKFVAWMNGGVILGTNPLDSTAMEAIIHWPAFTLQGAPLAPFVDVNGDGFYDPAVGDYPQIKGDQAIFFVYNDKFGVHTETGSPALGIEIRCMVYAYNCTNDSVLSNTVFTNYKIINKSGVSLDSVFVGNWTDLDIGIYNDDFVGCDVIRGAYYGYNGTTVDGTGQASAYGATPPAQAVVFLRGPLADFNGLDEPATSTPNGTGYGDGIVDNERLGMGKFIYYNNNNNSVNGNPSPGDDFYQFLTGTWKNGAPLAYGSDGITELTNCDYMFPGSSDQSSFFGTDGVSVPPWDESGSGNSAGDRRGLGSYGPFTLQADSVQEFDFAYVFGRALSGGNLAGVAIMKNNIDSVRNKFTNGIVACGCNGSNTGITDLSENNSILIFPNPATNNITVTFKTNSKKYSVKIYDVTGKMVKTIEDITDKSFTFPINDLVSGLYLLNVTDDTHNTTHRFIKQ